MPLPHEKAAIERAQGRHRERLVEAAAVLDRVRTEHPGVDDLQQLPPDVRKAALQALRAFRPAGGGFGVPELALVLLLAAGLVLTWFKPLRAFRCAPQGEGLAQCVVGERLFGLVPLREQTVTGIARSSVGHHTTTSQTRTDRGRTETVTTVVAELAFLDPEGRVLWSGSESHLIGASLEQVGGEVEALASADLAQPILRMQGAWPALLAGSLFVSIAFSALASKLGLALRERGLIPQSAFRVIFHWGALLLPVLLYGAAWLLAALGKDLSPSSFPGRLS